MIKSDYINSSKGIYFPNKAAMYSKVGLYYCQQASKSFIKILSLLQSTNNKKQGNPI